MKKQFRHILMAGLAMLTAATVSAQTLTQDWKVETDIPAIANARFGTGFGGKVYTNDKSVTTIYSFDGTAVETVSTTGGAAVGISHDDAGNLIILEGWAGAGAMKTLKLWNKATGETSSIEITLPKGVTAARMDALGKAVGDIFSETGGAVFFAGSNNTAVAKIFIANGVQVVGKSVTITTPITFDTTSIALPLTNDPMSNDIAIRLRLNQDFYINTSGEFVALTRVGELSSSSGGDIVTIGGVLYSIEPAGATYYDGFQVVNRETNEVIATHQAEATTSNGQSYGTSLVAEVVDDYTARIYQYQPGCFAAQYTLALPKPLPKLASRNAYAYDIKVAESEGNYTVSYRLNAPATAVKVQLMKDGEIYKEFEGTTIAEYADYEMTTVNNLNTVVIPATELALDATTSFIVAVTGDVVTEPTLLGETYKFWSPYGVVVDNNTDSDNFGRILVTESQSSLPATGYHSSKEENGIGIGIYAFDQMLQPIKNSEGKYGFLSGMTPAEGKYEGTTTTIYDFKRLAMSEDGRLFVSRTNSTTAGVYELNPNDLEAAATAVFEGTIGADGNITNADGEFVAGPATGLSVSGAGDELMLAVVSCDNGYALSTSAHHVDVYNLGKNKTWSAVPSNRVTTLDGYWINSATVNACLDPDGMGLMVGQYRGAPSEAEPAYKHVDLVTNMVDYSDITTPAGGAGMAWNANHTLFAMASGKKKVGIYRVTREDSSAPVYTKLYEFDTTCGTNTNAIAFDAADNLYVVSNSGEWLKAFALPRDNGEVAVAAPSKYDVTLSSDEYPAALYVIGDMNNWDNESGIKMEKGTQGVYTTTITANKEKEYFSVVSVLDSDWEVVNANRWGVGSDGSVITINQSQELIKTTGAMVLEGVIGTEYTIMVDLANSTITVSGEELPTSYPESMYILGDLEDLALWDPTEVFEMETQSEGVYYTVIQAHEGSNFAFTSDFGSWEVVNANRWGFAEDNSDWSIGVNPIVKGEGAIRIPNAGWYELTLDLKEMTLTVGEFHFPENLYMIGSLKNANWDITSNAYTLAQTETGVYSIEGVEIIDANNGFGYFAFGSALSETGNWDAFNANRFGPEVPDTEVTDNVAAEIGQNGDTSYKILAGIYDITVDLTEGSLLCVKNDGSVAKFEINAAKAVGMNGEIRILGDASCVSVYNAAGQAVVVNSAEKSINVAAGVYVVVVDGKTQKVVVR